MALTLTSLLFDFSEEISSLRKSIADDETELEAMNEKLNAENANLKQVENEVNVAQVRSSFTNAVFLRSLSKGFFLKPQVELNQFLPQTFLDTFKYPSSKFCF